MRAAVIGRPSFDDVATFVIAMMILGGAFYGLLRESGASEARVIYGGLIGAVSTFYFQRAATKAATGHTIEAQNNGLDAIRKGVARIEDERSPTTAERLERDAAHTTVHS